jgi:hypothetical protein
MGAVQRYGSSAGQGLGHVADELQHIYQKYNSDFHGLQSSTSTKLVYV